MDHSGIRPLDRLIDLANTVRVDPDAPPSALTAVLRRHGEPEPELSARDAADLRSALALLERVLTADGTDSATERINALLAAHAAPPRLSRHDGTPWHLHVDTCDDAPWGEWLLASSALALALVVAEKGRCAWGACAAEGCGRFFADLGRGSPRRFCSARCASRTRVAAHRRRASA